MLARGVRNVIYNYTDAQRKVREATSNDAWGPSPALMHEIADLTHNVVAYAEIMPIVWKRLNDHGKNWRHVYKSLVLLDYLIKYGNERVNQQCKENIFAIQTLKDFQYIEDNKDQGFNVREKAKQLVSLLKDDERLKNERRKAQEGRNNYYQQAMGMDSNGAITYGRQTAPVRRNSTNDITQANSDYPSNNNYMSNTNTVRSSSFNDGINTHTKKEFVQPTNQEEEQLQMQIALAESQREAEEEERRRRNDDLRLKMALERSVSENSTDANQAQSFDMSNPSQLDPSLFTQRPMDHTTWNDANPASDFGWNTKPTNNSGFSSYDTSSRTNDPWSSEPATALASSTLDPWQLPNLKSSAWQGNTIGLNSQNNSLPRTSTSPLLITNNTAATTTNNNPWDSLTNDSHTITASSDDPWGLSTGDPRNNSHTTNISPSQNDQRHTTKQADNELNEFFGVTDNYSKTVSSSAFSTTTTSTNPWNMPLLSTNLPPQTTSPIQNSFSSSDLSKNMLYPTIPSKPNQTSQSPFPANSSAAASRKTPESFLGDKFIGLVNLDKLVTEPKTTNPFGANPRAPNPFAQTVKPPTLEQLSSVTNTSGFSQPPTLPPPLIPLSSSLAPTPPPDNDDCWNHLKTYLRRYRNALNLLNEACSKWKIIHHETPLLFILQLGDIIDGISFKNGKSDQDLKTILEPFNQLKSEIHCQIYHHWGNHDFYNFKREILHSLPLCSFDTKQIYPAHYGTFEVCKHLRIISLDTYETSGLGVDKTSTVYQQAVDMLKKHNSNDNLNEPGNLRGHQKRFVLFNGGVSDKQLEWLNRQLAEAVENNEKIIITGENQRHNPIHPSACNNMCLLWNYKEVLDILWQYDCVIAVICGHDHDGGYFRDRKNIHHLTFSAIVETNPNTNAFATVHVYPDCLLIQGVGRISTYQIDCQEKERKTMRLYNRAVLIHRRIIYQPWKDQGISMLKYATEHIPHIVFGVPLAVFCMAVYGFKSVYKANKYQYNVYKRRCMVRRPEDVPLEYRPFCS
ncbi:unnamed protein product [Didymodactylos carnosus]|uniref:ENTH domain-containing protein n=1 Tax=Didymodactylos carnosus TaxID=1234261 RepID=A0A813QKH0_9BILA|nr:unnamed protein product [Didymodactylos carnosus]CAF3550004.1 unnamed protein product [Didymodactylos carnosus]